MKQSEAAALLGVIQTFDHRTVGEHDAVAWADVLGDLEVGECLEAVREHYRLTTSWCMPAHIRAHVLARRKDAAEVRHADSLRLPPLDHARSHANYLAAKAAMNRAVK